MSGWYMLFFCQKPDVGLEQYHVIPMGSNNTPVPHQNQLITLPIQGKEVQVTVVETLINYARRDQRDDHEHLRYLTAR